MGEGAVATAAVALGGLRVGPGAEAMPWLQHWLARRFDSIRNKMSGKFCAHFVLHPAAQPVSEGVRQL